MKLEEDQLPLRRPHFHTRGNELFFLISKRAYRSLSDEELEVWNHIDGTATVAQLREKFAKADDILTTFWDLQVIELAPSAPKPGRKRVLVIEPHMDDAILSLGALMWNQRDETEFTAVSVTGVSNFTSYCRIDRDYFDIDKVTELRRQESDLVMQVVGGRHFVLDRHDAPLRYQPGRWTLDWYKKNRRGISAYVNHSGADAEVDSWRETVFQLIEQSDAEEIWIPLGIGTSVDHETTRNACLWSLMQLPEVAAGKKLFFYHEVPYANNFPEHNARLLEWLEQAGARLRRVENDMGESLSIKQRLISIYASQFKMSYMAPKVEATARRLSGPDSEFGEPLIEIAKLPDNLSQFDLFSGKDQVLELCERLKRWVPKARASRRITILCPAGVGRWRDDMGTLLEFFSETEFDVHMTSDAIDETKRFESPRIRIHPVFGEGKGWLKRLIGMILAQPRPLIVLTGNPYRKLSPAIRAAFFMSKPLVATNLDYITQALRRSAPDFEELEVTLKKRPSQAMG